jgi:hypothetical protein
MARSTVGLVAWMVLTSVVTNPGWVVSAQTPVPQPFPGTKVLPPPVNRPGPTASPPAPAPPPDQTAAPGAPDAALAGVPLFPQAQFLDSFDAGQGQRYYLYGTNALFEEVAAHFRTTLMTGGRQLYRTPAIHQFDLGRFDDQRMAYPPSVVVKDYATGTGGGYLFVRDATEQRFRTIIQIVPPPAAPASR